MSEIKFFISYSTLDSNKKLTLKNAIAKRKGMKAIVVEDYRKNGIEFTEKVKNDLTQANYFIPIISAKSYQKSQWLNQEIGYAFAIFPKENILPIVQKNIIDKLKGFIHDKAEISYNYMVSPSDLKKERASFRKCIKDLLDDIEEKEKLIISKKLPLKYVVKSEYSGTVLNFSQDITKDLKLYVKVRLTSLQQEFRVYYKIITDKNETVWIGFTNVDMLPGGYITAKENSQHIGEPRKLTYEFTDSIQSTVVERIKMMNTTRHKINGIPVRIIALEFRGDPQIHDPIHYYYALD